MKVKLFVLIAFVAVAMPANAGDLMIGGSFPLVGQILGSQKSTEVHAGLTLLVNTSDRPDGQDKAVWTGGYVSFPSNKDGLFPEFSFLRVSCLALGIKPEQVKDRQVRSDDPEITIGEDGNVVVSTRALTPGQHFVVLSVKQNASRKETRILFVRFGKSISKTDEVAMIFMVTDPHDFVDTYCHKFEGSSVDTASEECIQLARSLYLEKEAGSFRLTSPILPYNALQETAWRERQGSPKVLDPPVKEAPVVETRAIVPPVTEGPVRFTINFVNGDGQTFHVPGMRIRIGEKAFDLSNGSPEFRFQPGTYQARFFVPGRGDSGWFAVKVWPGMSPVTVTVKEGVTQ